MKLKYFNRSVVLITCILSFVFIININCKTKAASSEKSMVSSPDLSIPALLEREGELAKAAEWEKTKQKVQELTQKILNRPNDIKSRLQLAVIYISEARITGEHPYYYPAILKILDGVLAMDVNNFEAMVYKASVKMSQHSFSEAKEIGEKARILNPDNAYIYGVLVDANVELGNYKEAIKLSDKMQSLKPSLESYARASYLREIYGDYPGAIEAMKMAVQAGLPGSEPWCWTKKTLAHLYEKTGNWSKAEEQLQEILSIRPSYALAIAAMARVEKEKKNYLKALELLQKAATILPEFSFHEEMAAIYDLQDQKEKAGNEYEIVINMLKEDERSGHSVALELCRVYIQKGEYDKAIEQGKTEYAKRPSNIDVNQELAWAYFKNKEINKAKEMIEVALNTGSKDSELLKRARLIKKAG